MTDRVRFLRRTLTLLSSPALLGTFATGLVTTGCSNGSGAVEALLHEHGSVVEFPSDDPSMAPSGMFIADPSAGGREQTVRLLDMHWGRLVDVFGLDAAGGRVLMQEDFVVPGSLASDGVDFALEVSPVTGEESLTILRDVTTDSTAFFDVLGRVDQGLVSIHEAGPGESGVYSMVPRNAALVLRFSDLLDESTVTRDTIRVMTGLPAIQSFEARILVDRNHGDLADLGGGARFHSTRVIVDTTVSEIESFDTDPPLPVNGVGLPAASSVADGNLLVRIPTVIDPSVGQDTALQNPTRHFVATTSNGPMDFGSPTVDVVRVMRSAGSTLVTGDPFDGFLPDTEPPRVVGSMTAFIELPPAPSGDDGTVFWLPALTFASTFCARAAAPGDVIRQDEVFAEVLEATADPQDGTISGALVRLLQWPAAWDEPGRNGPLEWPTSAVGEAVFQAPFDAARDGERAACFVEVLPEPAGSATNPAEGLATGSIFIVRFSEPMNPESLSPCDSMLLTRTPAPTGDEGVLASTDYVVGRVTPSPNLKRFTLTPDLPLAHEFLSDESLYWLQLASGAFAPTDLAGNRLLADLPAVRYLVDPAATTQRSGGRVTRFSSTDEEEPFGEDQEPPTILPEWAGQHTVDFERQLIRPRPVTRFQAAVEKDLPVAAAMSTVIGGAAEPLNPLGCKLQAVWRYHDMGLPVSDETSYNIDVEGLHWAPLGAVVPDHFENFEMRLSHSRFLPDEVLNATPAAQYPESGLSDIFLENLLDVGQDPQRTVHARHRGYTINPADASTTPSGMRIVPFPLNREVEPSEYSYYTWRDTGLERRAGPNGEGADPSVLQFLDEGATVYSRDEVRSVALPLLMEFRCYPDGTSTGLNRFDVSLAVTLATTPAFRTYTAGGIGQSGQSVLVDPDLEVHGNGGFNPGSGAATPGKDDTFYFGAVDFVTRVSRSYSVWYEAVDGAGMPVSADFHDVIVEPRPALQPLGTDLKLAFRGAIAIDPGLAGDQSRTDALTLDAYGDHYDGDAVRDSDNANTAIHFLGGDESWHDDIDDLDGARYYQVRATFLSNAETGATPLLESLAVSWAH